MKIAPSDALPVGALLTVCCLLACHRITTVAEGVYIPGDAPVEEKLAIAQSIGREVWEGGLAEQVRARFPELTPDQLAGVFLRWETISVTPVAGSGQAGTGVRIRTGIQHRGIVDHAQPIAKLCADTVAEAVRRRTGATDIYRIDLNEQSLSF
jgi:hypothetical protein